MKTLSTMLKSISKRFIAFRTKKSFTERAMNVLDDYLNAGCKEARKKASEKAKLLYREYYGIDYLNRNDR